MSETDDTDELLIIPPDFYSVNPELELHNKHFGPYYNVVDSLITQINQLEDRINLIQSSSDISLADTEMHHNSPSNSLSRFRKYNSSEDLMRTSSGPSESTQSTPQKPRTKFTLNSLPASPNLDDFKKSPRHAKRPEINPMLGEIDHFISNVKMIKRMNAVRNLQADFDGAPSKNLAVDDVNEMLKDIEQKQKLMEERIREKENQVFKDKEKAFVKETTWRTGDDVNSVPDYELGMRKNMYQSNQPMAVEQTVSKVSYAKLNQEPVINSRNNDKFDSESSSESTQMTAYDKYGGNKPPSEVHPTTVNALNLHKKLLDEEDLDYNLGLVSLSNLWNSNLDSRENSLKFQHRLQEERLRRQHCEQTITDLQNRILELQERVAVAIQVDEAKDKALLRFHECYEKANSKLLGTEKEREKLQNEVNMLNKKKKEYSEETSQKLANYEKETSKALCLAQSSQEKTLSFENRCIQLQQEMDELRRKSEELERKYMTEVDKNRQYPEIIAQKELELNEIKSILTEARKEVAQSKRAIEICQNELTSLNAECDNLQTKLNDEKSTVRKLNEEKKKFVEEVEAHKNLEKGLQEELKKTRDQIESNKLELKNFYQGQVELVVQNKLKEFQNQLDQAEKSLREEMNKKELSIAKTAANHIQQISEKYNLEIKLLEEKHQEQYRLYQVQVQQFQQEAEDATYRLKRQQDKHAHIERQLFKFMESLRQDNVTTVDEVNSFRSKSFNNLEEILSLNLPIDEEKDNKRSEEREKNSQGTYRISETPVSSKNDKGDKSSRRREISLQETIQMLLGRKPLTDTKEEAIQSGKDGELLYHRLTKEMKGKPPWK